MSDTTQIHPDKVRAYLATDYRIGHTSQDIILTIGQRSERLAALFAGNGVNCGAFLTSYNPRGTVQTDAAVKMHTLLDLRGNIPAFIHISDGKLGDVNVLDIVPLEAGAFYIMDRGYLDFARLYTLHQAGAFFVTRAKRGMNARRVYSTKTNRATGVLCDQRIALNGFYVAKDYPEHVRRIRFQDPDSGKTLVFLTNNTSLPPLTIAALYEHRWQVELFFKWIKQHLRIKRFLGTSENAVKTQIWCAVSTYVLIAIVKKELHLDASRYTCLQILSVSIFEKTEISCALQPDVTRTIAPPIDNQLTLLEF